MANVALLTGLDDVYMHRPAFTAAAASMVPPAAQPSSPHGHANSAAILSDSDCDSDLDYNPAAVESEVSSTDDDEEASVDILCGARADMDPKSRARAVRKLLPHHRAVCVSIIRADSRAAARASAGASAAARAVAVPQADAAAIAIPGASAGSRAVPSAEPAPGG